LLPSRFYDPALVIGEFTGPLDISEPGRPPSYVVNWNLGQASVRGLPSKVERASLVLEAPTVRDPRLVGGDTVFRAQHLELHGRAAAGSTSDNPLIESVLQVNAAVADKLHPLAAKPIDAEVRNLAARRGTMSRRNLGRSGSRNGRRATARSRSSRHASNRRTSLPSARASSSSRRAVVLTAICR